MSILKDGYVIYEEDFMSIDQSTKLFKVLNELDGWKYNTFNGYPLTRQTCVFIDKEIIEDNKTIPPIWGKDVSVIVWPLELLELKTMVEQKVFELTGKKWVYNIALGNKYTKRKDKISYHSDSEEFGNTQSIASISLGIPRTFTYMNKDKDKDERLSLILKNGSLIFMGNGCQENYVHGMKTEALSKLATEEELEKYDSTRINITFRVYNY
jgi:hypothetical protein